MLRPQYATVEVKSTYLSLIHMTKFSPFKEKPSIFISLFADVQTERPRDPSTFKTGSLFY